jgi:hypothetical protein
MLGSFLCLFLLSAPDRAAAPDEWGYRPADGATVQVNPPALSWVHEADAARYEVQWSREEGFKSAVTVKQLPWPVYTHHSPLPAGAWHWRYRIVGADQVASEWSRARKFVIPPKTATFPRPTIAQLKLRVPKEHPRLFVRAEDLPPLRTWIEGPGKAVWENFRARAEQLLRSGDPTPEPTVKASSSDPATNQFWWSNRVQTVRAAQEVEVLAFAWLLTGDKRFGDAARRFLMRLAAWDPDGPTNFKINCEAAKPLVHRLARGYDWAFDLLTESERKQVRAVLRRRGLDAWHSGEVREGAGHLARPYGSHANRTWHKLAENAVATLGETAEADQWLDYASAKFFAAYPVWSDDDGGWHEGLSYLAGYMSKAAWWAELARTPLGINAFRKPFFAHLADYALYSAPPGSPDLGLGDLAFRAPSQGWSFLHYYARRTRNPHWTWWLNQWNVREEFDEPVLGLLWTAVPPVRPKPPSNLPASKVFRGTGVAVLNTNLLDSADNVQVRFKSSPMARWSHGHEPQNSFTLNAYGVPLLVNNVYRDLYGSPFHRGWVWSTRAQNAVLVNGEGQKPHSADLGGRIVKWQIESGLDYVVGDATPAYEGRLTRALRHVLFVKPANLIVLIDDVAAPQPTVFQWMLHGQAEFTVDEPRQRLLLDRTAAGVVVDYVTASPLKLRQWTGYDPEPDHRYLTSIKSPGIPAQWHVEAASVEPSAEMLTVTVLRPYRAGSAPEAPVSMERSDTQAALRVGDVEIRFPKQGSDFALVQAGGRSWRVARP